jgi:hypothetical protein
MRMARKPAIAEVVPSQWASASSTAQTARRDECDAQAASASRAASLDRQPARSSISRWRAVTDPRERIFSGCHRTHQERLQPAAMEREDPRL